MVRCNINSTQLRNSVPSVSTAVSSKKGISHIKDRTPAVILPLFGLKVDSRREK